MKLVAWLALTIQANGDRCAVTRPQRPSRHFQPRYPTPIVLHHDCCANLDLAHPAAQRLQVQDRVVLDTVKVAVQHHRITATRYKRRRAHLLHHCRAIAHVCFAIYECCRRVRESVRVDAACSGDAFLTTYLLTTFRWDRGRPFAQHPACGIFVLGAWVAKATTTNDGTPAALWPL